MQLRCAYLFRSSVGGWNVASERGRSKREGSTEVKSGVRVKMTNKGEIALLACIVHLSACLFLASIRFLSQALPLNQREAGARSNTEEKKSAARCSEASRRRGRAWQRLECPLSLHVYLWEVIKVGFFFLLLFLNDCLMSKGSVGRMFQQLYEQFNIYSLPLYGSLPASGQELGNQS